MKQEFVYLWTKCRVEAIDAAVNVAKIFKFVYADVAKLANASDLSSDGLCTLWIQIPSSVPMGNAEM